MNSFDHPSLNPEAIAARERRLKQKQRSSCLSQIMLFALLLISVVIVAAVIALSSRKDKNQSFVKIISPTTVFLGETVQALFATPEITLTPFPTSTRPPATYPSAPTASATFKPTDTAMAQMIPMTINPQGKTMAPLELLVMAETTIAAETMKHANEETSTFSLPRDEWFEMLGAPETTNAVAIYPNAQCSWMGVAGIVTDARDKPIIGVKIKLGGFSNGDLRETLSGIFPVYGESGYEITIARPVQPIPDKLWIQLFNDLDQPVSNRVYFHPGDQCDQSLILINFQKER